MKLKLFSLKLSIHNDQVVVVNVVAFTLEEAFKMIKSAKGVTILDTTSMDITHLAPGVVTAIVEVQKKAEEQN